MDAIPQANFTVENFRMAVKESIALLKRLKASGKVVELKLYSNPPLVKVVILGDYLWLKHYLADLDVQTMPQYVIRHNLDDHGLYNVFCQYFLQRWENPDIREYDLDTEELIYRRRHNGNDVIRERFGMGAEPKDIRKAEATYGLQRAEH